MKSGNYTRLIFMATLAAVAVTGVVYRVQVQAWLEGVVNWVRELGAWGPVVLALIYIPACLLFVPGSAITLGAGSVFGLLTGFIAVSLGSTAGASAAFWAGRTLFRGWVEGQVAKQEKFRALEQAVATNGFKIVLLTRLSPVFPFNLLNYAYGVTRVRFRDYLFASWLGMMPGTLMYVYLGSLGGDLALAAGGANREKTIAEWLVQILGFLATVVVTVVITRIARRALAEAAPANRPPQPAPDEHTHAR